MEYEVRYYFSKSKLEKIDTLTKESRLYEKTMQFDHPDEKNSFYSKEIDGRFRIRVSKNEEISKCKIS